MATLRVWAKVRVMVMINMFLVRVKVKPLK